MNSLRQITKKNINFLLSIAKCKRAFIRFGFWFLFCDFILFFFFFILFDDYSSYFSFGLFFFYCILFIRRLCCATDYPFLVTKVRKNDTKTHILKNNNTVNTKQKQASALWYNRKQKEWKKSESRNETAVFFQKQKTEKDNCTHTVGERVIYYLLTMQYTNNHASNLSSSAFLFVSFFSFYSFILNWQWKR